MPPALLIPLYSHDELDVEEELQVNEETNCKQCIATDQNNPTVSSQPTKTIPVNKESVAFFIAGNVFQSCKNIHDASTTVKLPKYFGHECASGAPCSVDSIV